MELKEFISRSLFEITEGIREANEAYKAVPGPPRGNVFSFGLASVRARAKRGFNSISLSRRKRRSARKVMRRSVSKS